MVPAMDRSTTTPRRRFWIGFGLGLAVTASNSGCAELKAQIWGDPTPPGVIGRTSDTYNVSAKTPPPQTSTAPGAVYVDGVETPNSVIARVDEVGLAMKPAEAPVDASAVGVALQPPTTIEARSNSKLASATLGVPNASRILASSERRTETKPSPKPAEIVAEARAALDSMATYQVAIHRQERVNGSLLPEEDVVLAIRRSPRSVLLTWPSGPNQGREVLYRADEPGGQMHVKMANSALPRLSINPESPMVMKNSRHPVTEAGFDSLVEGLENGINAPSSAAISYKGLETPSGLDRPAHCLIRSTPSGESWKVYLDSQNHLPTLVEAVDAKGELLERYLFHDVRANPADLASSDAFDPNSRWGQPRGLLSRLAGGGGDPATSDTTPR